MSITKLIAGLVLASVGAQNAEAGGRFFRSHSSCQPVYNCQPIYSCAPVYSSPPICDSPRIEYQSQQYQTSDRTELQNQINLLQQQVIELDNRLRGIGG